MRLFFRILRLRFCLPSKYSTREILTVLLSLYDFISNLDILPHIAKSRPNLIENHMSLTLQCLLKCDLPDALVKVIVGTEDFTLSVRATVLLGELLHLANLILPREVSIFDLANLFDLQKS